MLRSKFVKFLMSALKWQVNSSSNFGLFFIVMTDNSSVDFKLILFNFGLKDPIKTPISRLSSALVKICHIHNIFQTTIQLKVMLKCWKECSLYTNAAHWISAFWTIHCLSEVIQIPHMIFEIWSQFCINFAPFCNNLAKT